MDTAMFEQALASDGYGEIETKSLAGGYQADEHSHPFDVRALVLAGEITLAWDGKTRTFTAGDVFTMETLCPHTEAVGPAGVSYLVGRRRR